MGFGGVCLLWYDDPGNVFRDHHNVCVPCAPRAIRSASLCLCICMRGDGESWEQILFGRVVEVSWAALP